MICEGSQFPILSFLWSVRDFDIHTPFSDSLEVCLPQHTELLSLGNKQKKTCLQAKYPVSVFRGVIAQNVLPMFL